MSHISILMENQPGALSRVVGLFSQRGYNIDSLSVAPTNDASLSRLTMVVKEEESVISQILKQLNKVIDVVEVQNLSDIESVSLEIAIVKLKITEKEAKKIIESAFPVIGEIINHKDEFVMIKLIGSNHEVDDFLLSLNKHKFLEVTRSGLLGMGTGENFLISESETTIEY